MNARGYLLGIIALIALFFIIWPQNIGAIVAFIFLGVIPGTEIVVPGYIMLPLFILAVIGGMDWIVSQPSTIAPNSQADIARRQLARRKVIGKSQPIDIAVPERGVKPVHARG